MPGELLARTLFPIGALPKADVRRIAHERALPVHDKRDSTGICFIGERPFAEFLGEEEITVYVLTDNGRDFITMSNICTHLGWRVRWIQEQSQFFCPCHNGIFDKNGVVVAGPPPRPLDRYETKVENDQIFIKVA